MSQLPHDHGQNTAGLLQNMPDFGPLADTFKQFSDATRLKLFWLLCHCEECVINLSAMMNMSSPALAHHLKLLKNDGLIVSRRDGKEVYYKVADSSVAQSLHNALENLMVIQCPSKPD